MAAGVHDNIGYTNITLILISMKILSCRGCIGDSYFDITFSKRLKQSVCGKHMLFIRSI